MLETERLLLRPFREEDAADIYEYLKAPMVRCFACMKLHAPEEANAAVKEKTDIIVTEIPRHFEVVRNGSSVVGSIFRLTAEIISLAAV